MSRFALVGFPGWLAAALLAAVLSSSTAADDSTCLAGAAAVDITPSFPVRLNGFGSRRTEYEGVTQRIWAKALAIGADEDRPAVLVTIDSLGVRLPMVEEVARRLKAKAGIERARFAVTFTHTHTAPKVRGASDTIMGWPEPPEHERHIDRYTAELTDNLERVALAALADRRPARLQWGTGTVGFAKNRRPQGGPVDHQLPVLVVRSADDDSIRAIYATYACHCVTLSHNRIGGDWAGYAQEAIQRDHPGAVALISIGCGSDSNPSSGVTGDNIAVAAEQGAEIAKEVSRLLSTTLKPVTGKISATLETIDLPLNALPSREALELLAANDDPAGDNAKYQLAALDRGEALVSAIDYPIQAWSFGDSLSMVFLAGEVCADYSVRLKRELDAGRLWLHGYSNDFCCYIPSERILKEGGYGGGAEIIYFALPATLAPGLENRIVAEVHRQLPGLVRGNAGLRPDGPAAKILTIVDGIGTDTSREYERIPDIWRIALDATRGDDSRDLLELLEISVPQPHAAPKDWQIVVVGGGIVNGLSMNGAWPRQRIRELVENAPWLQERWDRLVRLSAAIAGDESVPSGTRYDALRILGVDDFETSGASLAKYLSNESHELQMGAISGLSDMESEDVGQTILDSFRHYTDSNRQLAIAALLRTQQRRELLKRGLADGAIRRDVLSAEQMAALESK